MNIFGNLTQFDFVTITRRRNETAAPEEGLVSVGLLGGESGEFTPVISNKVNCDASCFRALYSRVNNIATCTYYLSIALDPGNEGGSFTLSLPVNTNFSNPRDAFGVITPITDPYSRLVSAITSADTSVDEIFIEIELSGAGESMAFVSNLQYIIQ